MPIFPFNAANVALESAGGKGLKLVRLTGVGIWHSGSGRRPPGDHALEGWPANPDRRYSREDHDPGRGKRLDANLYDKR